MKNYKENNHKINSITENNSNYLNSNRNLTIKYNLFALLIVLILIASLLIDNDESYNVKSDNSVILQIYSIKDAEVPSGINLSQITKNNDGIFMVGNELIPVIYRVKLADTTDIGYVERYNSIEMRTYNLIAKHTFEKDGYLIIEDDYFVVKLQGVKISLQQNFYLFGFQL